MSNEDPPKPKADPKKPAAAPKQDDKKPAVDVAADDKVARPMGKPPALDDRPLKFAELLPFGDRFDAGELVAMLRDGRGVVRANAALALAAASHPAPELVPLLRDSEPRVAIAAAEAVSHLGSRLRAAILQIAQALDGAHVDVTDSVVGTLASLVGSCDDELIAALDVPSALAMKSVVAACARLERKGIAFLVKAAAHERGRIRINAIGGLGRLGKTDPEVALALLAQIEASDPIPDVRTAAKQASLAVVAREKVVVVDALPKHIPDFETRKLSASELSEYASAIVVDEMIYALQDGRAHVKINASRALGVLGDKAAPAAKAMGLLLRDSVSAVRREVAKALGKLGTGALDAAADLVGALGDAEADVADAAAETLEPLGDRAQDALVRGLETGSEAHGIRVGELIGKLPRAAEILVEAFRSPAVNVQVNAALGLGGLGSRVGAGLEALRDARTRGDARTRAAVRRALDVLEAKGETGPKPLTVDGFEDRVLAAGELDKAKAELERVGVAELVAHLQDGRDVVRSNAATALGVLGAAAASAAGSLGVRLRDDAARVRLSAAQALDRIGDAAVIETANDLVGALRDVEAKNAEVVAGILRARKARMISALVRGLETDDATHGRRIVEVIGVLPDASDILCDAFESPAVNVQVNAAVGLGLLGNERVGRGRKMLEAARTGGWERTRFAVRAALDTLDGPRSTGPARIEIEGFEDRVLDGAAFATAKLRFEDLVGYLQDGRAIVRANSASALGALGPAAAGVASGLGVLCRDDDPRVRIAAANALDKLGDDAVKEAAPFLVGALRGDAEVGKAVAPVLASRKTKVLTALLKGLETDDDTHARRILEVINKLPDACEIPMPIAALT